MLFVVFLKSLPNKCCHSSIRFHSNTLCLPNSIMMETQNSNFTDLALTENSSSPSIQGNPTVSPQSLICLPLNSPCKCLSLDLHYVSTELWYEFPKQPCSPFFHTTVSFTIWLSTYVTLQFLWKFPVSCEEHPESWTQHTTSFHSSSNFTSCISYHGDHTSCAPIVLSFCAFSKHTMHFNLFSMCRMHLPSLPGEHFFIF